MTETKRVAKGVQSANDPPGISKSLSTIVSESCRDIRETIQRLADLINGKTNNGRKD